MNRYERRKAASIARKEKAKNRVKNFGEVFTPTVLVEEMLDHLPDSVFTDPSKTFLDPCCGNGQFLDSTIRRKIKNGSTPLQALSTTYGIEIQSRWVVVCRQRLIDVAHELGLLKKDMNKAIIAVMNNIMWGDALEMGKKDKGLDRSKVKKFSMPLVFGTDDKGNYCWEHYTKTEELLEQFDQFVDESK